MITHLFGSGFPKSMDISKAIDKMQGAEREIVGTRVYADGTKGHWNREASSLYAQDHWTKEKRETCDTAPSTPEAQQWQGYGTALKPANEHWILVRKPLSEKSIAENVLKWGTGGLNIAATRVGVSQDDPNKRRATGENGGADSIFGVGNHTRPATLTGKRFPSNLFLSHSLFCTPLGMRKVKGTHSKGDVIQHSTGYFGGKHAHAEQDYTDEDGMEEVQAWDCTEDCPVAELDRQSGHLKTGGPVHARQKARSNGFLTSQPFLDDDRFAGDQGGASRYFQQLHPTPDDYVPFIYVPKASKSDRSKKNTHPTVKSTALMRHLARMITPPNGVILDPFLGSASTAVSAIREGFRFIGIERDPLYVEMAKRRIETTQQNLWASA